MMLHKCNERFDLYKTLELVTASLPVDFEWV